MIRAFRERARTYGLGEALMVFGLPAGVVALIVGSAIHTFFFG